MFYQAFQENKKQKKTDLQTAPALCCKFTQQEMRCKAAAYGCALKKWLKLWRGPQGGRVEALNSEPIILYVFFLNIAIGRLCMEKGIMINDLTDFNLSACIIQTHG